MKCPNCNKEVPNGSKFCNHCGSKLEVTLACTNPNCVDFGKYILPSDSKFCPTCGNKLSLTEELIVQNSITDTNGELHGHIDSITEYVNGNEVYVIQKFDYHNIVIYGKNGEAVKRVSSQNDMCFVHIEEDLYHNIAYVTNGKEAYCIAASGISKISQTTYDMIVEDGENFVNHHKQYIGAYKIGDSSKGTLFLCYTNKHAERNNAQFADILTADGEKLFTTGKYMPVGMIGNTDKMLVAYTDSLCLYEKAQDGYVNVVDLSGRELLAKPLEISSYSFDGALGKESAFGLIFAGEQWAYNVVTNKDVSLYNKYIYLCPVNGDELCCDVYSSRTNKLIKSSLRLDNTGSHTLADGFTQIYTSCEYETLIGDRGQLIELKPREHVCDTLIAQATGATGYSEVPSEESFISDDRIITTTHDDDSWGHDNILFYRILDYKGKEVKKINSSDMIIKRGFYNGKALFVKPGKKNRCIGYLDKYGNEHNIPYKLHRFDEYEREIPLEDVDCEFVSESSLIIRNGYGNEAVIDLLGSVLFSTKDLITKLADGFFYTKELYSDNIKIYSAKGKFLFETVLYKVEVIK